MPRPRLASLGGVARGFLRVGAPADFGRRHLAPLLSSFVAEHPGVEANLVLSDIGLENEIDRCDLVLRFGLPNDEGMVARKIATTRQVVCAAPSYLERFRTPTEPVDLVNHSCLRLARRHRLIDVWRFMRDGEVFEVQVGGALSSGDGTVLRDWALSGQGISWEARWDVADDLKAGRLVELLPDYQSAEMDLYAVFAPGKPVPSRIRLFLDHLSRAFESLRREPGKDGP